VSERPKEHASKACEGATPPWVQIPPPPPTVGDIRAGHSLGGMLPRPHRINRAVTESYADGAIRIDEFGRVSAFSSGLPEKGGYGEGLA
jgi:hypothetical protein